MVKHDHVLHFNEMDAENGYLIGQCTEIPSIIVQAKGVEELKEKMLTAITGYFDAFPEAHDKLFADSFKTQEILIEA